MKKYIFILILLTLFLFILALAGFNNQVQQAAIEALTSESNESKPIVSEPVPSEPAELVSSKASDQTINSHDFIKMVLTAIGLTDPTADNQRYVEKAIEKGYMKPYSFTDPEAGIQRIEGIVFLMHVLKDRHPHTRITMYPELLEYFRDLPDVPQSDRLIALQAYSLGILLLDEDGIFRPHTLLTQKEAEDTIARFLDDRKRVINDKPKTIEQTLGAISFSYTDDVLFSETIAERWHMSEEKLLEFFIESLKSLKVKEYQNSLEIAGTLPETPGGFSWRYSFTVDQDGENPNNIKTLDKASEKVSFCLPSKGGSFSYTLNGENKPILIKGTLVWDMTYSYTYQAEYLIGSNFITIVSGQGRKTVPVNFPRP